MAGRAGCPAAVDVQDRDAAVPLLQRLRQSYFSIRLLWADGAYAGRLVDWAREELQLTLDIVKRSDDTAGFVVLPRRWVVERTVSWLMRSRRLVREYETLPAMHEAMVQWSMTMLMSSRLAGRRRDAFLTRRPTPRWPGRTPCETSAAQPRAASRFTRPRTPSTRVGLEALAGERANHREAHQLLAQDPVDRIQEVLHPA